MTPEHLAQTSCLHIRIFPVKHELCRFLESQANIDRFIELAITAEPSVLDSAMVADEDAHTKELDEQPSNEREGRRNGSDVSPVCGLIHAHARQCGHA